MSTTKKTSKKTVKATKSRVPRAKPPGWLSADVWGKMTVEERKAHMEKHRPKTSDIRSAKVSALDIVPSTQQPSIIIEVPLQVTTLYGVCLGYVSVALSRGWLAESDDGSAPYLASVYMLNVLIAYIQATTPSALSLPKWLQDYGQALAPKKARMQNGWVFYKFDLGFLTLPYAPPANIPVGYVGYGVDQLLWEQAATGEVDLFPQAAPPSGYTDSGGSVAWASLAQFMVFDGLPQTEVVPLRTSTWSKNVSAFAMPVNPEGLGYGTAGGIIFQASLEVPVWTPTLSVFANELAEGAINPGRYGLITVAGGGDPIWSGVLASSHVPKLFSSPRNSRFHAIDFLEFADVIGIWATQLLNTALLDTAFQSTFQATPANATCPLTLQEMQLILKNELMVFFNSTQCGVQSLYPRAPATSGSIEFLAYPCSSSTVGLSSSSMKLPLFIVENLRSLSARWVEFGKGKTSMFFVPILGQYYSIVLSPEDYVATYTSSGAPVTVPVFSTVPPTVRRRKDSKGESTWAPQVEATINLVDGSSGSNYYFINDTTRITTLTTLWNEWLQRLATYSVPLATLSRDLGVNICCSVGTTRHWLHPTPSSIARLVDVKDPRVESRKYLTNSFYSNNVVVAVSSHEKMYSAVLDQIFKFWILPVNYANAGSVLAAQSIVNRQAIIEGETYSVVMASQDSGITMSSLHAQYAQSMVKGPNSPPSQLEDFFVEQSKSGTGGILSSLAASWIGNTFGPVAGSIAGAISDFLPI